MPENPSVLILIKGLDIGGFSGGADLFGANLAVEFYRQGLKVILCVCYKFNTIEETSNINSLKERGISPLFLVNHTNQSAANGYIKAFITLYRYLNQNQIDIIHSHFQIGTYLSILLKLLRKVTWVVRTAHIDNEWKRGWSGFIKQSIIKSLIFLIFPLFVDQEFGVSSYTIEVLNQRLLAKMLKKKAIVIHNAVPVPAGLNGSFQRKNNTKWQGDQPVIGSVGRLEGQKGYEYFLNALPQILSQFSTLKIWLIGEGSLHKELEIQSKNLGVQEHIVFWGKQNNIAEFFSKMDIFISSSLYEGLPTVVLEAMEFRVPCILTDIPGTRDLIQEGNALVVPARKSQRLADAIIKLLQTPSLRQSLAENAMLALEKFRIEKVAIDYLKAYRIL